jgi:hypothetical protein
MNGMIRMIQPGTNGTIAGAIPKITAGYFGSYASGYCTGANRA